MRKIKQKPYQGNPCKRGHSGLRYAVSGNCVECAKALARGVYRKDPEAYKRAVTQRRRLKFSTPPTRPEPDKCEICGGIGTKGIHLDHDHTTGKFRGWLCLQCNSGLGMFKDNVELLLKAVTYLMENNKPYVRHNSEDRSGRGPAR